MKSALRKVGYPWARIRSAWGIQPLSALSGHDRGLPIPRYYAKRFIERHTADIKGHCLEFQEPFYLDQFGSDKVAKIDILHIDDSNSKATIIADLTKQNELASNVFDCIICTFVLHQVVEPELFVEQVHRILKTDGVLLVVVPHIAMHSPEFGTDYWRFTSQGLFQLLSKAFEERGIEITAYGNSLTSFGAVRGLVAHEFSRNELDTHDARFCSIVCARALKT